MHSDVLIYPYLTFVHQCNASVHSPLKRYTEWVFLCTCSTYAKYIFIYIYCRYVTFAPHIILYFVYLYICSIPKWMYNVVLSSFAFQRSVAGHSPLKRYTEWVFCVHVPHMLNIFSYIYCSLGFLFLRTSRIREGEDSVNIFNNSVPLICCWSFL